MLDEPSPIASDAYRTYLRDIEESGQYMLRMVQDMLDLRRIEAGAVALDRAPVDVANLTRMIARQLETTAAQRNVVLTVAIEPDAPAVTADIQTVRQALTNIVGNAVKFAASPGWGPYFGGPHP